MNKIVTGIMMSLSLVSGAQVKSVMPEPPEMPIPPPVFRPRELRENEKPVIVESVREIAAENGLFSRVSATITFTNPNSSFRRRTAGIRQQILMPSPIASTE